MKPRSTEPGPPLWKALAELTNRPAPIAPPLYAYVSMQTTIRSTGLAWQSSACVGLSSLGEACLSHLRRPNFPGRYSRSHCSRAHKSERHWYASQQDRHLLVLNSLLLWFALRCVAEERMMEEASKQQQVCSENWLNSCDPSFKASRTTTAARAGR